MIRQLISLVVASLLAALVSIGSGVATSTAASAAQESGPEITTDLTLLVPRCEDCFVTVFSDDGINPVYTSGPSEVIDGSVTITLPSARTAGMSVRVDTPWSDSRADTYVAWRYGGAEIGDEVKFSEARTKSWASGCWAGTVNEAVTLKIKVRRVSYFGRAAAIAWAPVTESYVRPTERVRLGVLARNEVLTCSIFS